jgi:hypothetical protein
MIVFTCVTANILFIVLAYLLRFTGTTAVMLILATVATIVMSIVYFNRPKPKVFHTNGQLAEDSMIKTRKIFTLASEPLEQN